MIDFLTFLNTANHIELTALNGLSPAIADGIIAARPFEALDDCLKVKGVGKVVLARIQSSYEATHMDNNEIVPAAEAEITPMEPEQVKAEERSEASAGPSFGSRLANALRVFIRALFRLVLVLVIIGGIGAGVYYGLPILRERYIAPVEQNTERLHELEAEVADLQNQVTEINSHLSTLDASIETHTASLAKLEAMQATLETELSEQHDETLSKLKQEVMLTRALDMLARARLYLAQSNFGLAREDVQAARNVLAELQNETNDPALAQAVTRLDLALGNLPDFPVVASGDLEIAWQILMTGKAAPPATATPIPSPTIVPTVESVTPTATP